MMSGFIWILSAKLRSDLEMHSNARSEHAYLRLVTYDQVAHI